MQRARVRLESMERIGNKKTKHSQRRSTGIEDEVYFMAMKEAFTECMIPSSLTQVALKGWNMFCPLSTNSNHDTKEIQRCAIPPEPEY